MAANVYLSRFTGAQVEQALERAMSGGSGGGASYRRVNLPYSGWVALEQTVSVDGATAGGCVLVSPDPYDDGNYKNYVSSGVRCVGQRAGALTFRCSSLPPSDLRVNVRLEG